MEPTTCLAPGQRDEVLHLLAAQHHTLSSRDLKGLRIGSEGVRALTRTGVLTRVARGAYVSTTVLAAADPDERHRLTALAVARTWPEGVAVSHASAAMLWGLPVLSRPDRVHGSRTGAGQFRRAARYTIHTGYSAARTSSVRGAPVVEPAFAVVGVLESSGVQEAVVCGDAALHRGLAVVDDLERAASAAGHPSARRLMQRAAGLMDPACESAGETLSRLLLGRLGYAVTSQVAVHAPHGGFVGRVDFLVDGTRVAVEFDGMVKYGERNALVLEKRRELALQRAGYTVVRIVWADLSRPDRVRELLETAIAADRARSA
ncbi:type IV toxin-antitoxin system AbiEi family antitoxin domain-containing protein [Ornithinimicrobium pekingense]|uniref:DUF559 domain-containing protein n=1 Tax=Ornithinimicrobium pekingense TaxID=384677 RepID=A0ABQ2FCP6_9MICO|nr:type IV toxin-antitoxin system AbiEi family antitoxin domain-containing protein [Ornithinimicrobium pekingense]GGK72816.1 hypothetical protein GCM10011509_21730 [Ornithinimicrobium pekingense]